MSTSETSNLDDSSIMEVTGRVLIATIIALVIVLVLVFLFHIYARWLWHRRQHHSHSPTTRPSHHNPGVTVLRRGLDPAFLKTIPVLQFDPNSFKHGLECSVCLSDLQQGEKARILPKCNHGFHAECIDMWFHSHSTCPICRNPVSDQTEISVETLLENQPQSTDNNTSEFPTSEFPTNVLFWGDETEVSTLTSQLAEANSRNQAPVLPFEPTSTASSSSSSSQNDSERLKPDLVIDIPRQVNRVEDDEKTTPISSGMRSLRRILSSSSRFNPFSPRNTVSEQAQG